MGGGGDDVPNHRPEPNCCLYTYMKYDIPHLQTVIPTFTGPDHWETTEVQAVLRDWNRQHMVPLRCFTDSSSDLPLRNIEQAAVTIGTRRPHGLKWLLSASGRAYKALRGRGQTIQASQNDERSF